MLAFFSTFSRYNGNGATRAMAIVVSVALVLTSCTDYKSRISVSSEPGAPTASDRVLPRPGETKSSIWDEEEITGWVKLRFDVSKSGKVSGIEIIESSNQKLEARAMASLSSWPFEPGTLDGEPAHFEDVEYVMTFYTDDTTTTGEAIGATALVIVLVPVFLAAALLGGGGSIGSIKFSN